MVYTQAQLDALKLRVINTPYECDFHTLRPDCLV